jgi:DNA modification methylase
VSKEVMENFKTYNSLDKFLKRQQKDGEEIVAKKVYGTVSKYYTDPKYEMFRRRYAELLSLEDPGLFTTVWKWGNEVGNNGLVITAAKSRRLTHETTNMPVDNAYNFRGYQKRQIVDGTNVRVSGFPKKWVKAFLSYFTDKGDSVFDPFMGHNSRMEAVIEWGRNYTAYDIAPKYVEWTQELYDKMYRNNVKLGRTIPTAKLVNCDSRKISEPDNSYDAVFSSPPFWDAEFYDDSPDQLGKLDYDGFMAGMKEVLQHCYNLLKPGHFLGWHIEDLRRDFKLVTYSWDTLQIMKDIGFIPTNIIATTFNSSVAASFKLQSLINYNFGKRHGYILIVKKPGESLNDPLLVPDDQIESE